MGIFLIGSLTTAAIIVAIATGIIGIGGTIAIFQNIQTIAFVVGGIVGLAILTKLFKK